MKPKLHFLFWAAIGLSAALPLRNSIAAPLSIEDAIQTAWSRNPGLAASASEVEAAYAQAVRVHAARFPSVTISASALRTDEPMMAFGLKLDQGRISSQDFDPAKLNSPDSIGAWGAGATAALPLYLGGRLSAGERAATNAADAAAADNSQRRAELAVAVVEVYFGAQAAEQGHLYAEELFAHARETERFMRERNAQGLAFDADLSRASAFRAQSEAELAKARQRRNSARSALALLTSQPADSELVSRIEQLPAVAGQAEDLKTRPDLAAARFRQEAAQAAVTVAKGSLLPEVFAQASAQTLMSMDLDNRRLWYTAGVFARWELSLANREAVRASEKYLQAATSAVDWRQRQASREVTEASGEIETASARVQAAQEAVTASESVRALRDARHRQGLLPLTDLLDAEASLAAARALLITSRLEARVARAHLALALHQPIEGLMP